VATQGAKRASRPKTDQSAAATQPIGWLEGIQGVIMTEDAKGNPTVVEDAVAPEAMAFAELIRPHMAVLVRLAARLAPAGSHDDVVQEALIRAWRHRGRYDVSKGPLLNWLLAIVANEARRAGASRRSLPIRLRSAVATLSEDDRIDLEDAVRRLSARQRMAVDCYYFVGLSVSETAAVMACTEGTVKSTLTDARARLRHAIEGRT
jgi:RNA polymerase sigma-70 factor (ECF subfamily)